MKLSFIKISGLLIFLLSGCASLSKQECQQGNWEIIGHHDGANGKAYQYLNQHSKACGKYGITPDANAYQRGRLAGLKSYCIESKGYQVGKNAQEFNEVCSGQARTNFITGYQRGLEQALLDIDAEMGEKNSDLVNKALEVSRLKGQTDESLTKRLKSLESDLKSLQEKKRKIHRLQQQYQ